MRINTLKALATAINAMGTGYKAVTAPSWTSTDCKPEGLRYIVKKGKGRKGTKLTVTDPGGEVVLTCDTSHTTPVESAVSRAVALFGDKLDTDPGELFAVGDCVRVLGRFMRLYGTVVSVKMKPDGKAKGYEVKFRNGHVGKCAPRELRRA